jgi:hypothetical protein
MAFMPRPIALALLAALSIACSKDGKFALSERIFQAPKPPAQIPIVINAGCTFYDLDADSRSTSTETLDDLTVLQQQEDDQVVVTVSRDGETLVAKGYDGAFLASGSLDDIFVPGDSRRVRYWGSPADDSNASCPPLDLNGP